MREAVRLLLKEGKIKSGYMIAIIAKPLILGKKYEDIQSDVLGAFRRAGLFV